MLSIPPVCSTPPSPSKKFIEDPKHVPADANTPDSYVSYTLKHQKSLPPITWDNWYTKLNWLNIAILAGMPAIGLIGETTIWSVVYYYMTGLGITAGYHRLWSHRSYNASKPLQYVLAFVGAGHRAHHHYTNTDLDPYNAHCGLLWSHIGWMIVKPHRKPGVANVSDLTKNEVVRWQHKYYLSLVMIMGFLFPTVVAGLGWGDWQGGYVYAGLLHLCFLHHSTFCMNSLAHWLGETPFDDKHSPHDHFVTALVTIDEGYHNFHHQFPMDYHNAIKWYQYDPTKWFIWSCQKLGFASHLKSFPDNEVRKGQLTMQLKCLCEIQETLSWPSDNSDLPIISWESCTYLSAYARCIF
ncbi:uncharacterized protein F5891DRAFT_1033918 [Suillus fuscotomentosus]|uniref:Fatty acid desaturase domain-containing protein n=1 Tax=Suillus fuscotomentosus TaxID=1912939 RepID=A0AAD4E8R7_9AGAM|nr:uncharacterized protein F5891DRAFT_1033918 [Suillus fuscotomentosus]KAG1900408.1 hypothetical protein F5891DRAFT_1033918 [Suillus fuscotomentosus]